MKILLSILTLSATLFATDYEGCSDTKQNALFNLSGNIKSSIQSDFKEEVKSNLVDTQESVETTISSYINASTNLSLVNIKYKKKSKDEVCAFVNSDDQTKNSKKMLKKALLFQEKNLPKNIDEKMKKLTAWINEIKQLNYLLPVFVDDSQKEQVVLNKKEKIFQDLYTDTLSQSNSLVWQSCEKNQEDAKKALNKKLFVNKGKEDEKGFFASISSAFSSDDPQFIDMFDSQLTYIKKDKKVCAIIKKDELHQIAKKMNENVKRFNVKSLNKNPKKRYKQIDNYFEHLKITKALIALYPDKYSTKDFNKIDNTKEKLEKIKKTTYPQFVLFHIKGEKKISIKLDNKIVENNKEQYVVHGDHSYMITTKDKCPIKGSFSTELFDDKEISEDFSENNYPTVLFITDKTPNIVVDGQIIKANVVTPIKKCSAEVRYIVKFAGQSRSGEFTLSPNMTHSIELDFLTSEELSVFNDAKSKNFITTSGTKFSESLTSITSEKLEFSLEESTEHGNIELHERGSFKYTSKKGFVGVDSFEYTIDAVGKTSAPKIVNITVNASNAPVAIVPLITEEKKDSKEDSQEEERYQRFKKYVDSQEQDIEKLQKLQKKYPDMFDRLLKEKIIQ